MKPVVIKGLRIGEGKTKTIVSLMDEGLGGLMATARRAVAEGADCLEWRADFFALLDDHAAVADACKALDDALPSTPLIFTFRSKGQGGDVELDTASYVSLVSTVISHGRPDIVDIELGRGTQQAGVLVRCAHEHGVRAIVSHHDFVGAPETDQMVELLARMASLGADIPKLAVMASDDGDADRLMRATTLAHAQLDQPLLTMAMGPAGTRTRLEGELFGSALTFCALGRASAPGQVELCEALEQIDRLHASLAGE